MLAVAGVTALVGAPFPSSTPVGVALAVEGALLVLVAAWGRFHRIPASGLLGKARPEPDGPGGDVDGRTAIWALAAITVLAVVLRLVGLDGDLWLDEIVTVDDYADQSLGTIFSSYEANNHLLNSVLVHVSIGAFGHEEWAVRLPALVAGVLAVPAMYWVARGVFRRRPSLLAALALAVAYHHVYFSQNARGYAASLLFGLLASGLLVRALRSDALRAWALYVATIALCVVAVPTGGFVLLGHLCVVGVALVVVWRRRSPAGARPLLVRAAGAYVVVGLVLVQAYAPVVSDAAGVAEDAWSRPEAGFAPLSLDFARGLLDDVSARGPLAAVAASVAALAGLIGLVSLVRRDVALLAALALGPLLNTAFVVARGLVFSPRFLVALVFPALLVAVETVRVLARWVGARRGRRPACAVEVGGALFLCAALALPLTAYYGVPKQPYREAVASAIAARQGGIVVAVYTAQAGVRYYGVEHAEGAPLIEGDTIRYARTAAALEGIERMADGRRLVLVTTFERALRVGQPRLDALVRSGWRPAATFRGSVGDGDVTVWLPA